MEFEKGDMVRDGDGNGDAGRVDWRPYPVLVYWLDYQESSREYSGDIRLYEKKKRK